MRRSTRIAPKAGEQSVGAVLDDYPSPLCGPPLRPDARRARFGDSSSRNLVGVRGRSIGRGRRVCRGHLSSTPSRRKRQCRALRREPSRPGSRPNQRVAGRAVSGQVAAPTCRSVASARTGCRAVHWGNRRTDHRIALAWKACEPAVVASLNGTCGKRAGPSVLRVRDPASSQRVGPGGPMRSGGGAGLIMVRQVPATAARENNL